MATHSVQTVEDLKDDLNYVVVWMESRGISNTTYSWYGTKEEMEVDLAPWLLSRKDFITAFKVELDNRDVPDGPTGPDGHLHKVDGENLFHTWNECWHNPDSDFFGKEP